MINIFTLNWQGKDKLEKLYPTLLNNLNGLDWKWHIKDNFSSDGSMALIESWNNPNIVAHKYENNLQNFSEGMNYLFNSSNPKDDDFILLLNNDVIFNDSTSLNNMINIMNNDNEVGVVGARLLYTGTNKIQHCGVVFDDRYKLPTHFRSKQESNDDDKKNRLFQVVTGAVLLTKAKYYKNVCTNNPSGINGLNEGLRWAFDDVDLSLSIKYNMNKKIVYCGKTNISHEESASLKKNPVNRMFLKHNIQLLTSKWFGTYVIDRDIYAKNPNHNLYDK
jgi:GT2 family glycosyltransferase